MKRTKSQKGITLVALIITIIVLLILAIVAIVAITQGEILQYAKNSRDKYSKAQENEIGTLDSYLSHIESNIPGESEDNKNTQCKHTNIKIENISESLICADCGEKIVLETGLIFSYGDYEYGYNLEYGFDEYGEFTWIENAQSGWGVRVKDTSKNQYNQLLASIGGSNITNMNYCFEGCTLLVSAPAIPEGVTTMYSAFNGCTSLETAPDISKASNLKNMGSAFSRLC